MQLVYEFITTAMYSVHSIFIPEYDDHSRIHLREIGLHDSEMGLFQVTILG